MIKRNLSLILAILIIISAFPINVQASSTLEDKHKLFDQMLSSDDIKKQIEEKNKILEQEKLEKEKKEAESSVIKGNSNFTEVDNTVNDDKVENNNNTSVYEEPSGQKIPEKEDKTPIIGNVDNNIDTENKDNAENTVIEKPKSIFDKIMEKLGLSNNDKGVDDENELKNESMQLNGLRREIAFIPDQFLEEALLHSLKNPQETYNGYDKRIQLINLQTKPESEYVVYVDELENIYSIDKLYTLDKISDLTGLEHCINLNKLHLPNNLIDDLTPLQSLTTLEELKLTTNEISDLTPLKNLTNLQNLQLEGNEIADVSPITNLSNLSTLIISSNQISDLAPLQSLTNLTWLTLNYNQISDITPLQNLTNLERLDFYANQISDITPLQNLTKLTILGAHTNQISDISPIKNLLNLEYLYLYRNNILDFSEVPNVKYYVINLTGQRINISPTSEPFKLILKDEKGNNYRLMSSELNNLTNDRYSFKNPPTKPIEVEVAPNWTVNIDPSKLPSFRQVAHIPDPALKAALLHSLKNPNEVFVDSAKRINLITLKTKPASETEVYVDELQNISKINQLNNTTKIKDITGLEHCTNLNHINLSSNQISDLTPLQNLTKLSLLSLAVNEITNLTPLQNITNLTKLYLSSNQISDITPLQNLTKLTYLNLYDNQISNLSPLQNLTQLVDLLLPDNQISNLTPLQNLTHLTYLDLSRNQISDITPLQNLTKLTHLFLFTNQISDITPLQNSINPNYLWLHDNQISDFSKLLNKTYKYRLFTNQTINITPTEQPFTLILKDEKGKEYSLTSSKLNKLPNNKYEYKSKPYEAISEEVAPNWTVNIDSSGLKRPIAHIPDPALKEALLYSLKNPDETYNSAGTKRIYLHTNKVKPANETAIYVDELQNISKIEELNNSTKIKDITGLEHCINIDSLSLSHNLISDISPLQGLIKLKRLSLSDNQISNISPMQNLINLEQLYLMGNQITNIKDLKNLTNLAGLGIAINKISNIDGIQNLRNLVDLDMQINKITDITPLQNLTNLYGLNLSENQIFDISPVQNMVNITSLELNQNQIFDITALKNLENLRTLELNVNNISDITPLQNLKNLNRLGLTRNQITDITPLENLSKLTNFRLSENQISDLKPLQNHVNLDYLDIRANEISDITPLQNLTKLETLHIYANQISDFSKLPNTPNKRFYLSPQTINLAPTEQPFTLILKDEDGTEYSLTPEKLNKLPNNQYEYKTHPYEPVKESVDPNWIVNIDPSGIKRPIAHIPDAALKEALLYSLKNPDETSNGKHKRIKLITPKTKPSSETEIYVDELENIFEIRALNNTAKIKDITGLEHCTNLTYLSLDDNQITDITPLQNLTKLTYLALSYNQISDIAPLQNLTKLTYLYLYGNQITDLTSLQNLTNLTRLWLNNNQISDITPLQNLNKLILLRLDTNKISDITPLQNLTNLTELALSNNQISDITPLENLTKLIKLNLATNQISNLTPLQNLTNLTSLNLSNNRITDITPLQNLTNLIDLYLNHNQITDITPLQNLTNLTRLHSNNNQISNIKPLQNLTNLNTLWIGNNQISDITPLQNLTKLNTLFLDSNQISDFSKLPNNTYDHLGTRDQTINLTPTEQPFTLILKDKKGKEYSLASPLLDKLPNNKYEYKSHPYEAISEWVSSYWTVNIDPQGLPAPREIAYIPDPALKAALLHALKNPDEIVQGEKTITLITPKVKPDSETEIYVDELENISKISRLNNKTKIKDITGLENCTNLIHLCLRNNQISDLVPLQTLTNLIELDLYGNQISDLTPLQTLINLTELDLRSNQISDITPIQNLVKLTSLSLSYNQISNITPLQNLTNITHMNLHSNQISDITPLQNLTNLKDLNLLDNQVSNITPLQNLTNITHLNLRSNQISDITPLQNLTNLIHLRLSKNQISDFSKLPNKTYSMLDIIEQTINLTPTEQPFSLVLKDEDGTEYRLASDKLDKLPNNEYKYKQFPLEVIQEAVAPNWNVKIDPSGIDRPIAHIPDPALKEALLHALKHPDELSSSGSGHKKIYLLNNYVKPDSETEVYVDELENISIINELPKTTKIEDITGLEHLINTKHLGLTDNLISDITPLQNLTKLNNLQLGRNQISDLAPLQNLTDLTKLFLNDNQITDLNPLQNLTNLTYLSLNRNQISDITPLQNLTSLVDLYFKENKISDVTPLQNLINLEELSVSKNQVSDVTPLQNLTKLVKLWLYENKILDMSPIPESAPKRALYTQKREIVIDSESVEVSIVQPEGMPLHVELTTEAQEYLKHTTTPEGKQLFEVIKLPPNGELKDAFKWSNKEDLSITDTSSFSGTLDFRITPNTLPPTAKFRILTDYDVYPDLKYTSPVFETLEFYVQMPEGMVKVPEKSVQVEVDKLEYTEVYFLKSDNGMTPEMYEAIKTNGVFAVSTTSLNGLAPNYTNRFSKDELETLFANSPEALNNTIWENQDGIVGQALKVYDPSDAEYTLTLSQTAFPKYKAYLMDSEDPNLKGIVNLIRNRENTAYIPGLPAAGRSVDKLYDGLRLIEEPGNSKVAIVITQFKNTTSNKDYYTTIINDMTHDKDYLKDTHYHDVINGTVIEKFENTIGFDKFTDTVNEDNYVLPAEYSHLEPLFGVNNKLFNFEVIESKAVSEMDNNILAKPQYRDKTGILPDITDDTIGYVPAWHESPLSYDSDLVVGYYKGYYMHNPDDNMYPRHQAIYNNLKLPTDNRIINFFKSSMLITEKNKYDDNSNIIIRAAGFKADENVFIFNVLKDDYTQLPQTGTLGPIPIIAVSVGLLVLAFVFKRNKSAK